MARFQFMSDEDKLNDIQILNRALFFENRGVWAYGFAAGKLSTSEVGKAVLELGLQNRADHEKHQEMLRSAITEAGGTPVQMEKNYDLSAYITKVKVMSIVTSTSPGSHWRWRSAPLQDM
jgi:hypothetical protein